MWVCVLEEYLTVGLCLTALSYKYLYIKSWAPAGMGKGRALAAPGNVVKFFCAVTVKRSVDQSFKHYFQYFLACVLRATTKKGRQLFWGKKCTPDKILATPINLPTPGKKIRRGRPSYKIIVTLMCTDGPKFVIEPRDQSADIGNQSATLSCFVDSRPTASIAWTLANDPAMRVLSRAETLVVRPVTERDFTSYRCTANTIGFRKNVSRVITLRRNGLYSVVVFCNYWASVVTNAPVDPTKYTVPD